MTSKDGRIAFITGASSGVGHAIACALAGAGYDLAVTASRDTAQLETLLRAPAVADCKIVPLRLDLRSEEDITQTFAAAVATLGAIDVLVNNAGRALPKMASEVTWADWDDVFAINLKGAYFLTRQFAAHCIERGRPGSVVNIASTHGLAGFPSRSVYGISKGGLVQMSRMLAIEWAPHNIRVNAVAPATVLTESRQHHLDDTTRTKLLARIPSGHFVTPEQVAAAVCFLAGPEADSITGQTLPIDGGLTAT